MSEIDPLPCARLLFPASPGGDGVGARRTRDFKRTRIRPPNVLENPNPPTGGPPAKLSPGEAEAREYVSDTLASARALMRLRENVLESLAVVASEESGALCE